MRQVSSTSGQEIQKMIDTLEILKGEKKELSDKIISLEQENDDLMKNLRVAKSSVENLTDKLQEEAENNVLLQGELEIMEEFKEQIQRMKDENKGMRSSN
jgi:predicted nuclease with TOPRIM domain